MKTKTKSKNNKHHKSFNALQIIFKNLNVIKLVN